jgi:tRNA A-37 threonylcarbamoyl transferase component Bud32
MSFNTRIGTEIAGYRLERQLGQGAFAAVYVAEHIRLGTKVAVKVLDPILARDEAYAERFVQESRIAAELDHPGIIPILNAGEEDGLLFIVMKYVQGRDLYTLVREQGRLSATRTSSMIDQIADGLDAAHARGLVHRDIKPQNILIEDNTERAYLIDFGIVKRVTRGGAGDAPMSSIGFKGTANYASPEQINGFECDARSDVYALGGVVYECLTGSAPYAHLSETAAMMAQVEEPPPSVVALRPELPYTLDTVVTTAMAKRPDDRFRSCGELASALRAAAQGRSKVPTRDPDSELHAVLPAEGETPPASRSASRAPAAATVAPLAVGDGDVGGGGPPAGRGGGGGGGGGQGGASGGRGNGGLSGAPRWLVALAGLGVAAIVALALVGAYELGKSGDNASASSTGATLPTTQQPSDTTATTATTTNATDVPPGASDQDVALWNAIPPVIRRAPCKIAKPEHIGGVASINCDYHDSKHGRILLHVDRFSDLADLQSLYKTAGAGAVAANGGHPDDALVKKTGRCGDTGWLGEGRWNHEGNSSMAPLTGRYACYEAPGTCDLAAKMKLTDVEGQHCFVVVWTNDDARIFAKAEQQGLGHDGIAGFYKFWHHQFPPGNM